MSADGSTNVLRFSMLELFMIVLGVIAILALLLIALFGRRWSEKGAAALPRGVLFPSYNGTPAGGLGTPQPVFLRTKSEDDSRKQSNSGPRAGFVDREELRRELLILIAEEAGSIKKILFGDQQASSSGASAIGPPNDQGKPEVSPEELAQTYSFSNGCVRYNEALLNQDVRSEFRKQYDPLVISVVNAVDRRRNEKLQPIFKTASEGNFLAIKSPEGKRFAVFPKFGLILQESSFGPGAVGEVFECANFNARFSYPDFRVLRPAVFVPKGEEDWDLADQGVLDIGTGQEA